MDALENYLERKPLKSDYDYPELEETALNDVIKLSSQSVEPIIKPVESDYNTTKEKIETTRQKAVEKYNNIYNSEIDKLLKDYQNQVQKIQKEFDAQKQLLNTKTKDKKKESSDETENQLDGFKKNYEYEVMTSEVVEWGNVKKYQQSMAEIRESVSLAKFQLDELYKKAEKVLSHYKILVPEKPAQLPQAEIDAKHNTIESFHQQREIVQKHLRKLSKMFLPKIFLNANRYIIAVSICIIFAFALWLVSRNMSWKTSELALILTGGLLLLIILLILSGKYLRKKAASRLMYHFRIISQAVENGNVILDRHFQHSSEKIEETILQLKEKHHQEKQTAREEYEKIKTELDRQNKILIKTTNEQYNQMYSELESQFNKQISHVQQQKDEQQEKYKTEYDGKLAEIQNNFSQKTEELENEHNSIRQRLKKSWLDRLGTLKTLLAETQKLDRSLFYDWQNPAWSQWNPEKIRKQLIRFGQIEFDCSQIADPVKELMDDSLKGLETVTLPAVLAFPNRCSLFLQIPHKARDYAISLVKAVMARLFTSIPSGQMHFNIFDPVGLGKNFVGFMHAADFEKALVGGRIWTESEHIQKCLTELTVHMENVIQKYLRNEYKTIEAYNQQAGEFAEPYRFLVIADFPTNFNDESIKRLRSIVNSGPRCGVYTIIICDESQKLPEGITAKDLALNGVHLVYQKDRFVWQNETLKKFPLQLDSPPSEDLLTSLMRKVGKASVESAKVELPFDTIAPSLDKQWSEDSTFDISVPIGRSGAKRLQYLQLGKGVNQHMLIAGKTGSGKSTLFHVIISNLALWYSPDEIEFYLVDFKQGVEFKTYAVHKLPHARAVAIESDREFGLSILQRLDAEMTIRGEKFRHVRVQDISSYRKTTGQKMPRSILIIDEFHILFTDDDKIAHEAVMLLEKLVRQGRAFGIHIILGSQTLAGATGIPRSIMGQMAVRIALQCSEMDAQIILSEDNVVARLLTRPGEAIYNDAGGMIVGNNPFQVAWLPKMMQDEYLSNVSGFSKQLVLSHEPTIIFEGNVPANISNNSLLAAHIQKPFSNNNPARQPPCAWLGEPVTIKDPTAVVLNRQNAANLLIISQQDSVMAGVISSALLSLLVQLSQQAGKFIILDGNPPDSIISAKLKRIDSLFPNKCRFVHTNQTPDIMSQVSLEIQRRLQDSNYDSSQSIFLFISGLQRFRMLYRKEDDWNSQPDEKSVSIDKQLADILREGPSVGIHTIIAADTFNTIEKVMDRQTLREFNNRVLFQMSASDSSNLIDSPIANQLGFYRALYYNEEQGILEKFRFYAPPDEHWLRKIAEQLPPSS